ncbi:hypothetical protein ACJJTC_009854 [Scirpophaga incertulas]
MLVRMQKIEDENSMYKKQINSLEAKVDMLERHSRSTSIEIRNLPKIDSENKDSLFALTKDIGNAIGIQPSIDPSEIRGIYRTKPKLVKNKKNAACWTSYSKVYMREAEGLPSRRNDNPEELHKYGI